MQRIKIPNAGERKYNVPRDDNYLKHQLVLVNKQLKQLRKRKEYIEGLVGKKTDIPETYYNKHIYLYVLSLEGGYYYVGQSRNIQRRFKQHAKGSGAIWTKLHKPIAIIYQEDTKLTDESEAAVLENRLTIEYAKEHGFEIVRGGGYCQMKPRWPVDVIFAL